MTIVTTQIFNFFQFWHIAIDIVLFNISGDLMIYMPAFITEYGGISRNITTFSRNIPEHHEFSDGNHATVYKHGRLTTFFITKVMDLSHFDGISITQYRKSYMLFISLLRVFTKHFESI